MDILCPTGTNTASDSNRKNISLKRLYTLMSILFISAYPKLYALYNITCKHNITFNIIGYKYVFFKAS